MGKLRAPLDGVMGAKGSWVVCCLLLASTLLTGCNKTSATGPSDAAATAAARAASTASAMPATSNTALPAPVSTRKSVDVTWTAPTANTDGSALTNLAGYTIYYGTSPSELTQSIDVQDAGATDQIVSGLGNGTWYFAVAAYTNTGLRSSHSSIVSKTIS